MRRMMMRGRRNIRLVTGFLYLDFYLKYGRIEFLKEAPTHLHSYTYLVLWYFDRLFGHSSHSVKSEVKKNRTKSEVSQTCVTHL